MVLLRNYKYDTYRDIALWAMATGQQLYDEKKKKPTLDKWWIKEENKKEEKVTKELVLEKMRASLNFKDKE